MAGLQFPHWLLDQDRSRRSHLTPPRPRLYGLLPVFRFDMKIDHRQGQDLHQLGGILLPNFWPKLTVRMRNARATRNQIGKPQLTELDLLPIRAGNSNVTVGVVISAFWTAVSSVAVEVVEKGSYMFPYIHIQTSCLPDFPRVVFVSVIAVHS